jgi:stage V sporulation protein SpoVS
VLATKYLEKDGLHIAFIPHFSDVEIEGKIRTAVKMNVEEHVPSQFRTNLEQS